MINDCSVIDLGFKGNTFTWINLLHNGGLIQQRLNEMIASMIAAPMSLWPTLANFILTIALYFYKPMGILWSLNLDHLVLNQWSTEVWTSLWKKTIALTQLLSSFRL